MALEGESIPHVSSALREGGRRARTANVQEVDLRLIEREVIVERPTWMAFAGSEAAAVVASDFAMTRAEVRPGRRSGRYHFYGVW